MIALNKVESKFFETIEEFSRLEIAPIAAEWSKGGAPAPELFEKAAELGLMRFAVPVEDGGLGFSFSLKARVCESLASADFGFAMSLVNTMNVAIKIAQCASPALKAEYLPVLLWGQASACTALTERAAGSDFSAIQTRAKHDAGGWVLDGEKIWITNARNASLAIVYAQAGDQGDRNGIQAFLVDLTSPGCRRYAISSAFPQSSTGTGGLILSNCQLPQAHLLSPGEGAFKSIMSEINGARVYVAAMCCGMLKAALDCVKEYGHQRQSFGQPLETHQAWRFSLAQAETDLAVSRNFVYFAAQQVDCERDAQLVSAQAKIHAVNTCQKYMPALLHAMGAEGLREEYPFARHLAATQAATLVDGSTEMLLERVAKLSHSTKSTS